MELIVKLKRLENKEQLCSYVSHETFYIVNIIKQII